MSSTEKNKHVWGLMKSVLDEKEVMQTRYISVSVSAYEKIVALLLCPNITRKTRSPVAVISLSYYANQIVLKAHKV